MTIAEYLDVLKSETIPNFFIICSTDTELRLVYLKLFCEAHQCRYKYVESVDFKARTRVLGKKEVLVLTDFKPVLSNMSEMYKEYNRPVVYMYTNPKGITKEVEQFYDNRVLIINEITKDQAEFILTKKGVAKPAIDYFIEHVKNPTYVRRYGLQMLSLCAELNISQEECFKTYYESQLRKDLDEDPTPFFKHLLERDFTFVYEYLSQQGGNEFYVYAAIFRWLEKLLRYKTGGTDYWDKGGLGKYDNTDLFKHNTWSRLTIPMIISLYDKGIKYQNDIKNTERDALTALEVYVCCIIHTLIKTGAI